MALRLAAVEKQMAWFKTAQTQTIEMLHTAMSMADMHQQILQRVSREVVYALVKGTTDHIALHVEGHLNLQSYYEAYRAVVEAAGQKYAELAVVIWSRGHSLEDAVARAKLEIDNRDTPEATESESDYEVESFGGDFGKSSDDPVSETAQDGG